MENSNHTGQIIGALLVGAAIGAALGILFAPDKGSATRSKIAGKTGDLADSLKEKLETLLQEVQKGIEVVKEQTPQTDETKTDQSAT